MKRTLTQLVEVLESIEGVRALVVYGSLVRGEYREGESDVNLAVGLEQGLPATLCALHEPLRAAWRAVHVEPFIVAVDEVYRLADAFPIKLLDIHQHHQVLMGPDLFANIEIRPDDLRLRVEQELRNHLLRLRRHYAFVGDQPQALAGAVYRSAGALRYELGALLHLYGCSVRWNLEQVFEAAADAFDLDRQTLVRLGRFRSGAGEPDIIDLFRRLFPVVERAVDKADCWQGSP